MDSEEAMWQKSRRESDEPNLYTPYTDKADPIRVKALKDMVLLQWTKSNTDIVLPSIAMPNTDIEDPSRRKFLMDREDPMLM